MARKRKAGGRNAPSGPAELDEKQARLGPITTYEDVADSEDEYFINRDKLMLNDAPNQKHRHNGEDSDIELSDEEVLAYDDQSDEDGFTDGSDEPQSRRKQTKAHTNGKATEQDEEDYEDEGWWGSTKSDYYNADQIETEADALEEEAEAKRLQKTKLAKMTEEDFIFDQDEWLSTNDSKDPEKETVTEVLKEDPIPADATPQERHRLLTTRYPEFLPLVQEFESLQPTLHALRTQIKQSPNERLVTLKYWILSCYVAALAGYFAILASPSTDDPDRSKLMDPAELRDHDVMKTLVTSREAWQKVKDMNPRKRHIGREEQDQVVSPILKSEEPSKKRRTDENALKKNKMAVKKSAKDLERAKAVEASLADLYDLPLTNGISKKSSGTQKQKDDDSDFGEEDVMDAKTAADKAARKKTLKFYTSQIAQKANKRSGAGRDAGGDMDIPHRERLRDRQARLLAEAEKRGKRGSKYGAELGDNGSDDDDDAAAANQIRNGEDDYYDMVANSSKSKRDDKAARYAAYAAASKGERVVEHEEVGEDGKRQISYAIEKNKGLTPRRKKDVRNPRVKKKKQYEAKQKKLRSMKPTYKGGEPKGGYQGETSGINTGVIKSVRL